MTTLIWKIRSFCEKLGKFTMFFRKTETRKIRSSGSLALGNSINECKEDRFSYLDITLNYIHFTHLLEYMQDFFYKFGLWSAWIWKKNDYASIYKKKIFQKITWNVWIKFSQITQHNSFLHGIDILLISLKTKW